MGLYDRDYARGNSEFTSGYAKSDSQIISFVKETYKLFAASMMAGAVGAYVGVPMAGTIAANFFPLFILEIGLLIGLLVIKNEFSKPTLVKIIVLIMEVDIQNH